MVEHSNDGGLNGMESTHIYRAIESLRNEVLALDRANSDRWQATTKSIDELKESVGNGYRDLNTRTKANETSIARLNLIVFGIGGSVSIAALGVILRILFGN